MNSLEWNQAYKHSKTDQAFKGTNAMDTAPGHPGWIEISVNIDSDAHEAVSTFLFDLGCEGIVTESFKDTTIKGYLVFQKNIEDIQNRISLFLDGLDKIFTGLNPPKFEINSIENQDWDTGWRKFFKPDQVSDNLLILPEWEPIPVSLKCHYIKIDPGPAFGTGQHPTTRMCLLGLEKYASSDRWTMLDVGTGSGILALYGAKLGAERIVALDNDPEAIRWAERNIELNALSKKIELSLKPLKEWGEMFFIITANLILGTILELCPFFPSGLSPEGRLILSGILGEQVEKAETSLHENDLYTEEVIYKEEWACLIVKRGTY